MLFENTDTVKHIIKDHSEPFFGFFQLFFYSLAFCDVDHDAVDGGGSAGGVAVVGGAVADPDGAAVLGEGAVVDEEGFGGEIVAEDFGDDAVLAEVEAKLGGAGVDLVMSDMLPNMTGVASLDSPRAIHLGELAAEFALDHLKADGRLLIKAYQGPGFPEFLQQLKRQFGSVVSRKPEASRDRSAEIYLLASTPRPQATA